nr:MAG TPA: deoxycytidylate deaminase [Bacteriophage sp.]
MKKYDLTMMKTALVFSEESQAIKLKVGAVLAKDGRILVTGYNGTISGQSNLCEDCFIILPELSPTPYNLISLLPALQVYIKDGFLTLCYKQDKEIKLIIMAESVLRLNFKSKDINFLINMLPNYKQSQETQDKLTSILIRLLISDKLEGKGNFTLTLKTKPYVLHAEQNVIAYAAKKGISVEGATLYITHSPCKECAKMIAQTGIKEVIYSIEYRDRSGIEFLSNLGIQVRAL